MTSSTSSSRFDWKVLSSIIAVLAAVELCLYFFEDRLSLDLQHIKHIPGIVEELREGDGERILFLGNSLTRAGIQADTVAATWAKRGMSNTTIRLIYPDDTTLSDWFYLFRRFVEPADTRLSFVFADDNIFADAGETTPNSPTARFGAGNQNTQFYDNFNTRFSGRHM